MAASTGDKITDVRNAARPNSARATGTRSAGGTSLACDNLSGWPTASKVHFVTYQLNSSSAQVAGTQLDCTGIVSGNTIGSISVIDGTDTGNSVNDVVEMIPTAAWGQDLADALTNQHSRTGTHTVISATSITTTGNSSIGGNETVAGTLGVTGAATLSTLGVTGNITSNTNPVWQYLGYTEITSNFTTVSATAVYVTGLTVTVTIPSGCTALKVTVYSPGLASDGSPKVVRLSLYSGASVGTLTTLLQNWGQLFSSSPGNTDGANLAYVKKNPTAGSLTLNVAFASDSSGTNTGTLAASGTAPAFILVECC